MNRVQADGPCFLIAEAGVNHNGSLDRALAMIDAAAAAGANAVKFQTFRADRVVSRFAPKAEYQKSATGAEESQLEMVRQLELGRGDHEKLFAHCQTSGIMFLSTPFDFESIDELLDLGVEIFKVPSGEITNLPYLRRMGSLGKELIVSTGMSRLREIDAAIDVLEAAGARRSGITILHCNTEYPTPFGDVNLRAMHTMGLAFGTKVGYSDHTLGIEVPVAAVALGARVIEKHFTLDRSLPGPDHGASLEPSELEAMVTAVRNVERALGDSRKQPSPSEEKNVPVARRSIVASRDIKSGDVFSEDNLTCKRPGTGISPMEWDSVIGRRASRDFAEDEAIVL